MLPGSKTTAAKSFKLTVPTVTNAVSHLGHLRVEIRPHHWMYGQTTAARLL